MRDQVLWRKTARIIELIRDRLEIPAGKAIDLFYRSHTFALLNNPASGLNLMSDEYIFEDFCREMER